METPTTRVPAAPRPAPQPPVEARPRSLSVTAIARLIRDPYAIYAREILRLRPLDPLHRVADAPLRGIVLHKVMETFINDLDLSSGLAEARRRLLQITDQVLQADAPWPAARILWKSKLARVADKFLEDEIIRQSWATKIETEIKGALYFPELDFTLTATADRIDLADDRTLMIYDYKTGTVPSKKQLEQFDKQLLLEAVIAEAGGFERVGAAPVSQVAHIGLGAKPVFEPIILGPGQTAEVQAQFVRLIGGYQQRELGYTSRRAMAEMRQGGDYDHLARYGEWDDTVPPAGLMVGP
jgi:RecB family exonuclease